MKQRKSAYGADPVERPVASEPGVCAVPRCFLPATSNSSTQCETGSPFFCAFHDGQKSSDSDAITDHLLARRSWFNFVALAQTLPPHEFDDLVSRKVEFAVPQSLQPMPGMNAYQWRQHVRVTVRERLMAEIENLVNQRAAERGVDQTKTRPDRLSWAAMMILKKTTTESLS